MISMECVRGVAVTIVIYRILNTILIGHPIRAAVTYLFIGALLILGILTHPDTKIKDYKILNVIFLWAPAAFSKKIRAKIYK